MDIKVEISDFQPKTQPLNIDMDLVLQTLVGLIQCKKFRSAWNFLKSNADPEHFKFYNAGVVLQHLSNQYGDIGDLKDECFLQKELDRHASKVLELL